MSDITLQLVWVAAVFGLRKFPVEKDVRCKLYNAMLDLWDELDHPPFPYTKPAKKP